MSDDRVGHRGAAEDAVEAGPTVGRFVTFLDAAVAIALTLLVLPLLEAVDALGEDGSTSDYLRENSDRFLTFALSFMAIATFWLVHHRILEEDTPFGARLAAANLVWLAAIVMLPVATAITGALEIDRPQILFYVGTMVLGAWTLVWVHVEVGRVRRDAGLDVRGRPDIAGPVSMATLYTVALVIALAAPSFNYFALFVLFLIEPLRRVLAARLATTAS